MTLSPYDLGWHDGYESPYDLTAGITWEDDQDANEEYDRGVSDGQAARKAELAG